MNKQVLGGAHFSAKSLHEIWSTKLRWPNTGIVQKDNFVWLSTSGSLNKESGIIRMKTKSPFVTNQPIIPEALLSNSCQGF